MGRKIFKIETLGPRFFLIHLIEHVSHLMVRQFGFQIV